MEWAVPLHIGSHCKTLTNMAYAKVQLRLHSAKLNLKLWQDRICFALSRDNKELVFSFSLSPFISVSLSLLQLRCPYHTPYKCRKVYMSIQPSSSCLQPSKNILPEIGQADSPTDFWPPWWRENKGIYCLNDSVFAILLKELRHTAALFNLFLTL